LQAGGHRFDPGQLHQLSFTVSGSLPMQYLAPTRRQAAQPFEADFGRFQEPQGSASFRKKERRNDV